AVKSFSLRTLPCESNTCNFQFPASEMVLRDQVRQGDPLIASTTSPSLVASCNHRWVMLVSLKPDRIWLQPTTTSPTFALVTSAPGSRSLTSEQRTNCKTSTLPEGISSVAPGFETAVALEAVAAVSSAVTGREEIIKRAAKAANTA